MSWLNAEFPIANAIQRGLPTWELFIDEWGNTASSGSGIDGTSLAFPPFNSSKPRPGLPSVYGIAIGPKSTVDRCWVAYDLEQAPEQQGAWNYARALAVGAPLMFAQTGQAKPLTGPYANFPYPILGNGSLNIFPAENQLLTSGTQFGEQYFRQDGTLSTFGQGIGPYPNTNSDGSQIGPPFTPYWEPPLLHLVFYLAPPLVGPPAIRAPYVLSGFYTVVSPDQNVRTLMAQIPIFGRKRITITCAATNLSSLTTFEAGVIRPIAQNPGLTPFEGALVSGTTAGGNASCELDITIPGDYLNLYVTSKLPSDTVAWTVYATD